MKTIRKSFMMMLLAAGLSVSLAAQGHEGHPPRWKELATELKLSDAQLTQLEGIHDQYKPQVQALRAQGHDKPEVHAQLHALRQAEKAEVAKVLSPEQLEQLKAIRHAHRQDPCGHGKGGHDPESRHYRMEQIMPVLMAQRLKLEGDLSATDKDAIAALRVRLHALKTARKAAHDNQPQSNALSKEQHDEFHAQHHAIFEEASVIAQRYASQIDALHAEIKPQIDRWQAEMDARHQEHGHGDKDAKGAPEQAWSTAACPRKAARFLLMDPSASRVAGKVKSEDPSHTSIHVYPNPASSRATLQFRLPQAGKATVELVNAEGKVLRLITDGNRAAGEHLIDLDTQDLGSGTYYFRLSTHDGVRVRQFTVQH